MPPNSPVLLHVEDHEDYAYLVRRVLRQLNPSIEFLHATDGEEGLALAEQHRPSLILLDLGLPKLPGMEVLRRLRVSATTKAIPVVIFTDQGEDANAWDAYQHYANAFVVKPDQSQNLEVTLRAIEEFWFQRTRLPAPPHKLWT